MYDAIQKLDKKFDSLHRRVSEIHQTRRKPLLLKQKPVGFTCNSFSSLPVEKIQVQKSTERRLDHISLHDHGNHSQQTKVKLQRAEILTSSAAELVPCSLQPESQLPAQRQSPPLPTIVSTQSLCSPFSLTSEMPDFPSQMGLVNENPLAASSLATASHVVSSVMPTPPAASLERNNFTATYNSSPRNINTVIELPSSSSSSVNPAVASSCSLYPQVNTANGMSHLPSQPSSATIALDSPVHMVSSVFSSPRITHAPAAETSLGRNNMLVTYRTSSESTALSNEMPSSSMNLNFEFVGDPKRNVKILGNYLMKAKLKTKPKYAARYLVRLLFPKETLLYSVMGAKTRGRRALDQNKVAAIREFLTTYFPTYDLSEHGRDWETCVTNVNTMIRYLRYETKTNSEILKGKEKPPDTPGRLVYVDLVGSEDESEFSTQTSSKSNQIQNSEWNNMPEILDLPSSSKVSSLEPMAHLGNPSRNVQLPFPVICVAKGKCRPELSARYLIRHLFTEDVLVKSNVYGNLDRGTYPLDCNKINALRDFLQENYPSFELKETGYDWKACVAAINSTIRSLRFDHKRALAGIRNNVLAETPLLSQSSKSLL
ncbi:BEN domain-containing protein 2 isoform X2 [Sceloporus undulatus]|nr:BEN domain-containing protein 2 isoform X2 [Sceloporus undulatus]